MKVNRAILQISKTLRRGLIAALSLLMMIGLISGAFHMLPMSQGYSGTNAYIDPPETRIQTSEKQIGDTFSVSLVVANITDLAGYEWGIYWNTTILELVSIHDYNIWYPTNWFIPVNNTYSNFNATHGAAGLIAVSITGIGVSGTFVLRDMAFRILSAPANQIGAELNTEIAWGGQPSQPSGVLFGNSNADIIPCEIHNGLFSYLRSASAYVDPSEIRMYTNETQVGETFTVSVIVANIADLWSYEYAIYWKKTVLEITNIRDYNPWGPVNWFVAYNHTYQNYNATHGCNGIVVHAMSPAVSGNFILREMTFKILSAPANQTGAKLSTEITWGYLPDYPEQGFVCFGDSSENIIPCELHNGLFSYAYAADIVPPELNSISWKPARPYPYVPSDSTRANEETFVSVNVTDQGLSGIKKVLLHYRVNAGEWWNTTMNYNATLEEYSTMMPAQKGSSLVEFFVQAEDNAGNVAVSSMYAFTVKPTLIGDINGDGVVNVLDLIHVANHLGQHWP